MARVKIVKFFQGSPDGIHVASYSVGQEYDMPDELARVAVSTRSATFVTGDAVKPPEVQAVQAAPETKAPDAAPVTKVSEESEKAKGGFFERGGKPFGKGK